MKRNTIYDRIIKGLRNKVAILGENGYHSIVDGHGFIHACWANGGPDFLRVQVRCFFVTKPMITQKVPHKSI